MTVLLLTIGSAGDVHPFIAIGLALRARGHRVRVIVNPYFGDLVQRAGLEFVPLGSAAEFERLRRDPRMWDRRRGVAVVMKAIGETLGQVYRAVVEHYVPGETVIAASSLALGARVAQDEFDLPMATVHLAPAVFASAHTPPKLPGLWMPGWLPTSVKAAMFDVGHRWVVDRMIAPVLNGFRAEHGLPPVRRVLQHWWNSPRRVIGLWPEWYAPPQPDWPANTALAGFPLYDESELTPPSAELEAFLDGGEPPIVFTPGSAMQHGQRFFETAVAACVRLGRRGILLTRHREQLPAELPERVRHFDYEPLSRLLPRSALIVHHGGIGTSAAALAAGVPQIICPFSFDQLDNGRRLEQLGVGRVMPTGAGARSLAAASGRLLGDSSIAARTIEVAALLDNPMWGASCARAIESLESLRT